MEKMTRLKEPHFNDSRKLLFSRNFVFYCMCYHIFSCKFVNNFVCRSLFLFFFFQLQDIL